MLQIQSGHNVTIFMHNKGLSINMFLKVLKFLHPNVPNSAMFEMWVHPMGRTDQSQTL
jgi:hypothetical protein